jgi:hypothetical protein
MITRDEVLFRKIVSGALEVQPSNTADSAVFVSLRFAEHWKRVAFRTVYLSTTSAFVSLSGDSATFPLASIAFQTIIEPSVPINRTVSESFTGTRKRGLQVSSDSALATSVGLDAGKETQHQDSVQSDFSETHYTIVAGGDESSPTWRIKAPNGAQELVGTLLQQQLLASANFGPLSNRALTLTARIPSFALGIRVDGSSAKAQRNKLGLTRLILNKAVCDHDFQIGSVP